LFKDAARAIVTRRAEDEPPPKSRRSSGETGKGSIKAVRCPHDFDGLRETHRAVARAGAGKAFAKAAKKALLDAPIPDGFCHAGGYGGNLFDPVSAYWQGNSANNSSQWQNANFDAKQDNYFPQP
jgi:hypothetical protein